MTKTSEIFRPKWFLLFLLTVLIFAGCSGRKVQTVKVEAEANQIINVLGENGIRAKKNEVGEGDRKAFEILVNGDDEAVAAAIQLMEDHCLGQPDAPEPEGGPVITSIEVEKARADRRTKMNIETQLRKLVGVTCVNVNFVPPQDRSLAINPYQSTASVVINYKTAAFPYTKEDISGLVANSVPALKPENVSVVISAKPLRPLPENKIVYNFTRIALVSGIGFGTILAFVSIVFVLRKKRRNKPSEEIEEVETAEKENSKEPVLLDENYDFDEDEDENLP